MEADRDPRGQTRIIRNAKPGTLFAPVSSTLQSASIWKRHFLRTYLKALLGIRNRYP